jgi:hypothetical protein
MQATQHQEPGNATHTAVVVLLLLLLLLLLH